MPSTRLNRRVTMDSLTTRPHFHTICHIEYVWTPRSWPGGPPSTHLWRIRWWLQWLKNFLPRMNARNFSERSWPSSKRLKFLRCLQVLQRRPTCSCYVVMPSSRTSTSSPSSSFCSAYSSLWRLPCGGSWTKGPSSLCLADFAPHWRSLLGNCRATGIVEDGVGIAFQQRPQLTHQSISFRTRNSRQDLKQAVDALLMKGAIERVTNVKSLGFYSRLFLVPKKTGDLRPVIDLSTLNRHMVVPHFKMETQGSDQPSEVRSGRCR